MTYLTLLILVLQISILTPVQQAFRSADVNLLVQKMESDVTIMINGEGGKRPAKQAGLMLKQFFSDYPVKDIKWVHNGNSPNTEYTIGKYESTTGDLFRVFIVVSKETGKIKQIRISKYESED